MAGAGNSNQPGERLSHVVVVNSGEEEEEEEEKSGAPLHSGAVENAKRASKLESSTKVTFHQQHFSTWLGEQEAGEEIGVILIRGTTQSLCTAMMMMKKKRKWRTVGVKEIKTHVSVLSIRELEISTQHYVELPRHFE